MRQLDTMSAFDSGRILAENTTDRDMARLHLEKAVRTGQDLWHPVARA